MRLAYTYTILRYRHDPVAGEAINVGIVLHCPKAGFLAARVRETVGRLTKTFPDASRSSVMETLRIIERRVDRLRVQELATFFDRDASAVTYAKRALADEDSCFVWSEIRTGVAVDPQSALQKLYDRFVAQYDSEGRTTRDDNAVWQPVRELLAQRNLTDRLQEKEIVSPLDRVSFDHAWKNGSWHCYQPLSFDLASPDSIREKAAKWSGHMLGLSQSSENFQPYFFVGAPTQPELNEDYQRAVRLLRASPNRPEVFEEADTAAFVDRIEDEMREHDLDEARRPFVTNRE